MVKRSGRDKYLICQLIVIIRRELAAGTAAAAVMNSLHCLLLLVLAVGVIRFTSGVPLDDIADAWKIVTCR